MPNWTTIKATQEDRTVPPIWEQFITSKEDEDGKVEVNFDFNTLIPMPEELNVTAGGLQDKAIAYYLTERLTQPAEECNLSLFISNMFNNDWANDTIRRIKEDNMTDEEAEELYQMGKQYVSNKEKYGHCTWYGWCCENWGTKWNACDTIYEPEKDPYSVRFLTAWCAPSGIINELAGRFPDMEIYWGIEYEGDSELEILCSCGGETERVKEYETTCIENDDDETVYNLWARKKLVEKGYIDGVPYIVLPDDLPELEQIQKDYGSRVIPNAAITDEIRKAIFAYEYVLLDEDKEEKEFFEKYM